MSKNDAKQTNISCKIMEYIGQYYATKVFTKQFCCNLISIHVFFTTKTARYVHEMKYVGREPSFFFAYANALFNLARCGRLHQMRTRPLQCDEPSCFDELQEHLEFAEACCQCTRDMGGGNLSSD